VLSSEDRKPYYEKNNADKIRYNNEIAIFNKLSEVKKPGVNQGNNINKVRDVLSDE